MTRDKDGKIEKTGKVRIQVDIYPKALAEMNKVGEARQEPNCNPFLAPPVGRLSFSLNPLKMFVSYIRILLVLISHLVITCWASPQKKDLLLLLHGCLLRYLHNVITRYARTTLHCNSYGTFQLSSYLIYLKKSLNLYCISCFFE